MRASVNFWWRDGEPKCDAFGHFDIFRFIQLESIELQSRPRLYKPLALVAKFRNFAFSRYPDAPRWSIGILQ